MACVCLLLGACQSQAPEPLLAAPAPPPAFNAPPTPVRAAPFPSAAIVPADLFVDLVGNELATYMAMKHAPSALRLRPLDVKVRFVTATALNASGELKGGMKVSVADIETTAGVAYSRDIQNERETEIGFTVDERGRGRRKTLGGNLGLVAALEDLRAQIAAIERGHDHGVLAVKCVTLTVGLDVLVSKRASGDLGLFVVHANAEIGTSDRHAQTVVIELAVLPAGAAGKSSCGGA